jgi:hypothetical protein
MSNTQNFPAPFSLLHLLSASHYSSVSTAMLCRNGDDLAALAKRERMAALVRRKMPAAPGGTPKWLLDVSIMTWCSKERKMVDEPYHSMPKDSVKTYLKEQMKKAADDSLKIVFVTI